MSTASLFHHVRQRCREFSAARASREAKRRPIFLLAHPINPFGRQEINGPPGTRSEDPPLSDKGSVKVDDAQAVLWSAEILETSEFEVFEAAYQAWYRETPDITRLERIFAGYMFDEVVPFWVRQFTRTILEAHDDWRRGEEMKVHEYLVACLRAASTTIISTAGLALSLFLPRVVRPWIDADYAVLPA